MAVNSINDIWNAVCDECKTKISEIAFDTFFKYLKPESVSGEEFVLSASNDYIKGMIQSVYKDIINDAIEKVMGIKIPAKFIVADEEEKRNMIFAELYTPVIPEERHKCKISFPSFKNGSKNSSNSSALICEVLVSAPSAIA